MKIALFSDTHASHGRIKIPDADILIFAGDMTHCRTARDVSDFNRFLGRLPHTYKIVVGGNHDHRLARDTEKAKALFSEALYLLDDFVVISGITIYGAPWQPLFNDRACDAFALPRGKALKEKWDMIPPGVDILVTHTPPAGILDQDGPVSHGCSDLTAAVAALKPRYHIFGHIHSHHGMVKIGPTSYINCNVQGKNGALRPAVLLDYNSGELLENSSS
ncbi:MAG: metallophosphatase domain-containing protein [Desulfobulbaceae bacterium]|nr:metallophosphatase domain-containing protein [Desulfobulbaceae bacterium]